MQSANIFSCRFKVFIALLRDMPNFLEGTFRLIENEYINRFRIFCEKRELFNKSNENDACGFLLMSQNALLYD